MRGGFIFISTNLAAQYS